MITKRQRNALRKIITGLQDLQDCSTAEYNELFKETVLNRIRIGGVDSTESIIASVQESYKDLFKASYQYWIMRGDDIQYMTENYCDMMNVLKVMRDENPGVENTFVRHGVRLTK